MRTHPLLSEPLHLHAACAICGAPVHVVVSPSLEARWCCIFCGAHGSSPCAVESSAADGEEEPQRFVVPAAAA